MNGLGKGSPVGEEGLLLLLMFAENKSEGRGVELENMWIDKLSYYEGIY